jgi:hypothetical protein
MREDKISKPSFYSFMAFTVQQRYWQKTIKYKDTIDYAYWKDNGWLDPSCEFYKAHKANYFKVRLARIVGSIVAVFFT